MAIARYFDYRHDDGGVFGGVPKADLSEEEWDALPKWLQESVDNSNMYRKTPVPKAKAEQDQADEKDGD